MARGRAPAPGSGDFDTDYEQQQYDRGMPVEPDDGNEFAGKKKRGAPYARAQTRLKDI